MIYLTVMLWGELCSSGCRADQIDDCSQTDQGFAPPVHGDVGDRRCHAVPFARAWRIMAYHDRQSGAICETLQLSFPQAGFWTVAAARVGRDQQVRHTAVHWTSHVFPPAADRMHGETGRVVIDTDPLANGGALHVTGAFLDRGRTPRGGQYTGKIYADGLGTCGSRVPASGQTG